MEECEGGGIGRTITDAQTLIHQQAHVFGYLIAGVEAVSKTWVSDMGTHMLV